MCYRVLVGNTGLDYKTTIAQTMLKSKKTAMIIFSENTFVASFSCVDFLSAERINVLFLRQTSLPRECSALRGQSAVSDYLKVKQLLLFVLARPYLAACGAQQITPIG